MDKVVKYMAEESEKRDERVSEATIRELSKKKTDVCVLKYFLEVDKLAYAQEIADKLLMDLSGISFSLNKLVSCDLIEEEKQHADSRVKYFRLLNETAAKQVLECYKKKISEPKPEEKSLLAPGAEEV
jgi:predicted transcriptional regulator